MARKKAKKTSGTTYQRNTRKISRWRSFRRTMQQSFRRGYYVTLVVLVCTVIGAGWWWVHSGKLAVMVEATRNAVLAQTAKAGLELHYIYLEGREHASVKEVTLSLGLEAGDPILGVSVDDIRERLSKLGWVRDAVVERQLPDTLHIRLIERRPMALWQNNGKLYLIDESGKILEQANANAPQYRKLMLVVGEDAPTHAEALMAMLLSEPDLLPQISSAIRVGNRRWNIRLYNDIEVKLPSRNPEKAWAMLAAMHREQHVLARDIREVDLRLQDRVFIDIPPDANFQPASSFINKES